MQRITTPVTTEQAVQLVLAIPGDKVTDPALARNVLGALRTGARGRRMLAVGPLGSGKLTSKGDVFFWTRNPDCVHASLRGIDAATR